MTFGRFDGSVAYWNFTRAVFMPGANSLSQSEHDLMNI